MTINEYGYNVLNTFKTLYPELVREMKDSDHNGPDFTSTWHLEDDVWSHSMMVVSQVNAHFDGQDVTPRFKRLFLAALLHDIGKPASRTVDKENNRVMFNGHSGMSTLLAHNLIEPLDSTLSFDDKIYILQLINYHQVLFAISKESSSKAINKLADKFVGQKELFNDILLLRKLDFFGNISNTDDNVSYEKLTQVEALINASVAPHWMDEIDKPFMKVLVGLPCSGKDFYLENEWSNAKVVSRDDIVMEFAGEGVSYSDAFKQVDQTAVDAEFEVRFQNLIKAKQSFFVNRTNLTHKGRMKFINRAKQAGFRTKVTVFFPDLAVIAERNKYRIGKTIPDFVFVNMMKSFEMPYTNEGEIIYMFNY